MALTFKKATKAQARARVAIIGPSGSGKTYSMLLMLMTLGKRVAVIDTEHGSASKYAGITDPITGVRFDFDVLELASFAPERYVEAIEAAVAAGYDALGCDSLSHAWAGKDGALEQVDKAAKRSNSGNSFAAWRDITPKHNNLVEALVSAKLHLVVTMRSKMEYVLEEIERNGRKVTQTRKIGLAPIQREGLEYEFDVVGDIDLDHRYVISKTRCPELDGAIIEKPGVKLAVTIQTWLQDGVPVVEPPAVPRFRLGAEWKDKPLDDAPLATLQEYWERIVAMLQKADAAKQPAIKAHLDDVGAAIKAKEEAAFASTFGDDKNDAWGLTPPGDVAGDGSPPCNEPPASSNAA